MVKIMNFKRLVAKVNETGEELVLYDGSEFQNFDRLRKILGSDYENVNDELMDGITERDGEEYTHFKYENGDAVLSITFTFTPVDKKNSV